MSSDYVDLPAVPISAAISVERFPLLELKSPRGQDWIETCRAELNTTGVCEIQGFLTELGLKALLEESRALEPKVYRHTVVGNAYLDEPETTLPEDHPRRLVDKTDLGVIAMDQLAPDSLLKRIFEWDPLMEFIGQALELKEIYRYADPMGGVNLAVMAPGDYLRWHFDQTDFVTSIAIQSAEQGGVFEYVPMIRNSREENFSAVKAVLQGEREGVKVVPTLPGSLVLFKGRHSLHRVTAIEGGRVRYIALLGYDSKPDVVSSDHLRRMRYGRVDAYTSPDHNGKVS